MRARWWMITFAALASTACDAGGWYERCATDGDCGGGLSCVDAGDESFCSIECGTSELCEAQFGVRGFCGLTRHSLSHCESDADCPGDSTCDVARDECRVQL